MKNYLSFGGGVNSVALHLYLLDQGWDFEAVFVNHGTDWPETYEYFDMFQEWLDKEGLKPITVLNPKEGNLYEYCWKYKMVPARWPRWCTRIFKIEVLLEYYQSPCFQLIGFDFGEMNRIKITIEKGMEKRYPLIEAEITRQGCKEYIKHNRLPLPIKSGCYICPFQTQHQWKELRMNHPDLFCKAEQLEKRNIEYMERKGKKPWYIYGKNKPLRTVIEENQRKLFKQDEYPPCECML